jgi:hypothetical protein
MMPDDIGYGVQVASFRARLCAHRSQLKHLLADPEMVALIEASPQQAGRLLRPVCNMLGIEPIPALQRKRRVDASLPPPETDRAPPPTSVAAGVLPPGGAEEDNHRVSPGCRRQSDRLRFNGTQASAGAEAGIGVPYRCDTVPVRG